MDSSLNYVIGDFTVVVFFPETLSLGTELLIVFRINSFWKLKLSGFYIVNGT